MAFVTEHSVVFLHAPKTGGMFVVNSLESAGLFPRPVRSPGAHVRHALLEQLNDDRYRWNRAFAFVRHPVPWYESLWKFVNTPGASLDFGRPGEWHPFKELPLVPGVPFDQFVAAIIASRPGFLTAMLEAYIGPPGAPRVQAVGRCEELPGSLIGCLEKLDVSLDVRQRQTITRCKPVNVSRCQLGVPVWPASLKRDVLHLERAVIERWYR